MTANPEQQCPRFCVAASSLAVACHPSGGRRSPLKRLSQNERLTSLDAHRPDLEAVEAPLANDATAAGGQVAVDLPLGVGAAADDVSVAAAPPYAQSREKSKQVGLTCAGTAPAAVPVAERKAV
jgi:hypothetical protein